MDSGLCAGNSIVAHIGPNGLCGAKLHGDDDGTRGPGVGEKVDAAHGNGPSARAARRSPKSSESACDAAIALGNPAVTVVR